MPKLLTVLMLLLMCACGKPSVVDAPGAIPTVLIYGDTPFNETDSNWTYISNTSDKDGSVWAYFVEEDSLQTNPQDLDEKAILVEDINSKERMIRKYVLFFECSQNIFEMDSLTKNAGILVQKVVIPKQKVEADTPIADIQSFVCAAEIKT